MLQLYFTDTEIKKHSEHFTVLVDTREQENRHILDYFEKMKIPYREKKLDYGDYSCTLDVGLGRELDFRNIIMIERKNSLDELAGTVKERTRFEGEWTRATRCKMRYLVVEGGSLEGVQKHQYRSDYEPKAFYNSIVSMSQRFDFKVDFVPKELTGAHIARLLGMAVRNELKRG